MLKQTALAIGISCTSRLQVIGNKHYNTIMLIQTA